MKNENNYSEKLNNAIEETYQLINKLEEQIVKNSSVDLTISEIHVVEAVAKNDTTESCTDTAGTKTISEIAQILNITLPSVTISINKLQKKGYVEKLKCKNDGRSVRVKLTKRGEKINNVHRHFHKKLVNNLVLNLTENEKECMLNGMLKLENFLKQNIKD